jgi:hypothetical protein
MWHRDLTGRRFGRLQVLWPAGYLGKFSLVWACQCDCGTMKPIRGSCLKRRTTRSCGCLNSEALSRDQRNLRHGHTTNHKPSPEYKAYVKAKGVCQNPNHDRYQYYGGRGIEFRFESFDDFIAVVGPRPHTGMRLERHNRGGHFEPGNVGWSRYTPPRTAGLGFSGIGASEAGG